MRDLRPLAAIVATAAIAGANLFVRPGLPTAQAQAPAPGMTPFVVSSGIPTLPPANAPTTQPFPAFGTPAPGVTAGTVDPGVPQILSLDQAILIAVARSPILAAARADVALARASTSITASQGRFSLSGSASITQSRTNSGAGGTTTGGTTTGVVPTTAPSGGTGGGTGTGTGGGTPTTAPTSGPTAGATSSPGAGPQSLLALPLATAAPGASTAPISGGNGGFTSPAFDPNRTSISLGVSFRQLIFDGGRLAAQINAAQVNEVASAETYRRQLQTVAYNVASSYYNALSAQRTTQVDNQSLQNALVQENLVAATIRAGTAARSDLSTSQFQTAQARLTVVRAQQSEINAQAALANAMGLDADTLVRPADDAASFQSAIAQTIAVPTYQTAVTRALALRPDFRAAQLNVRSAESSLRAARLGRAPTINATGGYTDASTNQRAGDIRNTAQIGLSLSIPIIDGGLINAQIAQAQANIDRANANLRNTQIGVQLNVKQALVNLIAARAAIDQAQAEYNRAVEQLRATQAQYRAGVTTLPSLVQAQTTYATALSDQVTTIYSLRTAEQAFLYAEGANIPQT